MKRLTILILLTILSQASKAQYKTFDETAQYIVEKLLATENDWNTKHLFLADLDGTITFMDHKKQVQKLNIKELVLIKRDSTNNFFGDGGIISWKDDRRVSMRLKGLNGVTLGYSFPLNKEAEVTNLCKAFAYLQLLCMQSKKK